MWDTLLVSTDLHLNSCGVVISDAEVVEVNPKIFALFLGWGKISTLPDPEDWDKMVADNEDTQSLFEIKVFLQQGWKVLRENNS